MSHIDKDEDGVADHIERWISIAVGVILIGVSIHFMYLQNPNAPVALYPGIGLLLGDAVIKRFMRGEDR